MVKHTTIVLGDFELDVTSGQFTGLNQSLRLSPRKKFKEKAVQKIDSTLQISNLLEGIAIGIRDSLAV